MFRYKEKKNRRSVLASGLSTRNTIVCKAPTKPDTPLLYLDAFQQEVQKVYDFRIAHLIASVHATGIDALPNFLDVVETSRFDLYTSTEGTLRWLRDLPTDLSSHLRSIVLWQDNVWPLNYLNSTWDCGDTRLTGMLIDTLTSLREVFLWMPHEYDSDAFGTTTAPGGLCNLLEKNGSLNTLAFLFHGSLENHGDHPFLARMLMKEELDVALDETWYQSENEGETKEIARIVALGPRFDVRVEYPDEDAGVGLGVDADEKRMWWEYTVITFRPWNTS